MSKLAPLFVPKAEPKRLYLDLGCGRIKPEQIIAMDTVLYSSTKPEEWEGIDQIDFGQKHVGFVQNVLKTLPNDSVDGVFSAHFVEHLKGEERVVLFNELYRVMKVGAIAKIIVPHWSNACAYGDPTHQWPPMSEWFAYYLNKAWREGDAQGNGANGPHTGYTCDFDYSVAGSWDQRVAVAINGRNQEFAQKFVFDAMNTQVNGWRDLIATLTKRAPS